MDPESRQTIHVGINFVFAPTPTMSKVSNLKFQQALMAAGIEYTEVRLLEYGIEVRCGTVTPLVIKVISGDPRIGQLLILAPQARGMLGLDMFIKESEATVRAFEDTWGTNRQILTSDVTIRDLFHSTREHGFQEIWEDRLGQSRDALAVLGPIVQGGGLRLVIPPLVSDPQPVEIELKIESFLRDTHKIWIETVFKWPQARSPHERMEPASQLRLVDKYIEERVIKFMTEGRI